MNGDLKAPGSDLKAIQGIGAFIEAPAEVGRFVRPPGQIMPHMGGKYKWAAVLEQEFTELIKGPFAFLDCFGGSGFVTYLVTSEWGDISNRYWNDLDKELYDVFKFARTQPEQLTALVYKLTQRYLDGAFRGSYEDLMELMKTHPDPIVRSAARIVTKKASFMGRGGHEPYKFKDDKSMMQHLKKVHNGPGNIAPWLAAFQDVTVWNKSFRDAIQMFTEKEKDMPQRIVFLDPPYMVEASKGYAHNMTVDEHRELAGIIKRRENTYALTHSESDLFYQIYGEPDYYIESMVRYKNKMDDERTRELFCVWLAK